MRGATDQIETCGSVSCTRADYRIRVILADGSLQYMDAVLVLLELHDILDLIGRAANFDETVQLVTNHQPDLVLVDLDMPFVNLLIPAIILCSRAAVRVVGLSQGIFPYHPNGPLMDVDAVIRKQELWDGLLPVMRDLYGWPQVWGPLSAQRS